jgi:hypothetical protein
VGCLYLKGKNTAVVLPAHMKVFQPNARDKRNDSHKYFLRFLCRRSFRTGFSREFFLLQDYDELALGNYRCASGSKLFSRLAKNSRPPYRSHKSLPAGPITLRLVPELQRPTLEHRSLAWTLLGRAREHRIDAREYQINCLAINLVPDCLEANRCGGRPICGGYNSVLAALVRGEPLDENLSDKLMLLVKQGQLPFHTVTSNDWGVPRPGDPDPPGAGKFSSPIRVKPNYLFRPIAKAARILTFLQADKSEQLTIHLHRYELLRRLCSYLR